MAKKTINIGTGPNVGDGDVDRVAWGKVNDNFTELYTPKIIVDGTIEFDNPKGAISGTNLNVITGNITIVDAEAEDLNSAICFHQGGKPTYSGGTIIGELGDYAAGVVNIISLIRIAPGNYLASYGGEVKNLVTSGADVVPPPQMTISSVTLAPGDVSPPPQMTISSVTLV